MMRNSWIVLGIFMLLANLGLAWADEDKRIYEDRKGESRASDPHLLAIRKAADAKDYPALVKAAEAAVASNGGDADYHNMLAFGLRNLPNPDMARVFMHYNEALRIDPFHVGAHEYLGEAYVMVGNLNKAKEHLERVRLACQMKCAEYLKLENAIQAAEGKPVRGAGGG